MAKYFNFFPRTLYSNQKTVNGLDTVTNIITRFTFESKLKENGAAFYEYDIQESDTPEIIAYKFYGNAERHWIVLLFNDIIDPQYDWPLSSRVFAEYVEKKYFPRTDSTPFFSGLSWAKSESNVQAYFKVITNVTSDGQVDIQKYEIDEAAYNALPETENLPQVQLDSGIVLTQTITKQTRTYYTYELEENEKKRRIKLLRPEFVPQVEKEFKRVIRA